MSKYAERLDALIDTLGDAAASIKQAQYDLGGPPDAPRGEALGNICQARKTLDAAEYQAVALLRSSGATWQEVADALGMTRQAAHERFRGSVA
jgi:hypothetical protein